MRPLALALGFLLAACASQPSEPLVWKRTDGRPIPGNEALTQQARLDQTVCQGETAKVAAVVKGSAELIRQTLDDTFAGCMAQRGYLKQPQGDSAAISIPR